MCRFGVFFNMHSVRFNNMDNLDLESRHALLRHNELHCKSFPTLDLISMKPVNQGQQQRKESGALQCVKRARDLYRTSLPSIQGIKRLGFSCIQIGVAILQIAMLTIWKFLLTG